MLIDLIKHNENTITSRSNFFLLAESMLITGYATFNSPPIIVLGFIISGIWLIWGYKSFNNTRVLIEEIKKCREDNEEITFYFKWRNKVQSCTKSNFIFCIILLLTLIVFWVYVF